MAVAILHAVTQRTSKPKRTSCGLRLQSGNVIVNREGRRGVDGVAVKGFQGASGKEKALCFF